MISIADSHPAPRVSHGFSLVEVVLALGVISVAIVSLLGLLSVSTAASRSSDEDTVIAAITRQADTELRNLTFANLPPSGTAWYFDNEGHRLTVAAGAIYQCQIFLTGDPDYNSTGGIINLYRVELVISRALGANAPALRSISTAIYRND